MAKNKSVLAKKNILQHRKMSDLLFATASNPPETVAIPLSHAFCIENCGTYRKIRFKNPSGRGVEVTLGSVKKFVSFVDVRSSVSQILAAKKWPYVPIAWWVGEWESGNQENYARRLSVLGQVYRITFSLSQGASVDKTLSAVEENLKGVDFQTWAKKLPKVTAIVEDGSIRYTVNLVTIKEK